MVHSNHQTTKQTTPGANTNQLKKAVLFCLIAIPLLIIGCKDDPTSTPDPEPEPKPEPEPERVLAWEATLNNKATNWITDKTSGPKGWCGDITHYNTNGPVSPASGSGYAVAEHGACNDFWQGQDVPSSGPYAFFGNLSDSWPENGFEQQLDIYLDPSWSAGPNGSVFTYANSFRLLDGEYPNNLRYVFIPVTKKDGNLQVMGNNITEKGWYSFRFVFSKKDGNLGVTFKLLDDDQAVFSSEIGKTSQSGEQISSFEATNIGNGYGWFVAINPDLGIPVDEQQKFHKES